MKPFLKYDSLAWGDVSEGDQIPAEDRLVDTTLIVSGAIASRDFYPVHHDKSFAEAAGSPDIFINILTTNGLIASYLGNWCGPDWDVESIDLRLKIPAFPGQELKISGTVTDVDESEHSIGVEFVADTEYGPHCQGTARLRLAQAA
jgi:acyl dehydratase